VQYNTYEGHQLIDNPFTFFGHLKSFDEFQKALRQVKKHREDILSYSISRRLINAEDLDIVLFLKDYYNTVRKEKPNKSKSKTIIALLRILKNN
jgi:hypothetical protein